MGHKNTNMSNVAAHPGDGGLVLSPRTYQVRTGHKEQSRRIKNLCTAWDSEPRPESGQRSRKAHKSRHSSDPLLHRRKETSSSTSDPKQQTTSSNPYTDTSTASSRKREEERAKYSRNRKSRKKSERDQRAEEYKNVKHDVICGSKENFIKPYSENKSFEPSRSFNELNSKMSNLSNSYRCSDEGENYDYSRSSSPEPSYRPCYEMECYQPECCFESASPSDPYCCAYCWPMESNSMSSCDAESICESNAESSDEALKMCLYYTGLILRWFFIITILFFMFVLITFFIDVSPFALTTVIFAIVSLLYILILDPRVIILNE